MSDREIEPLPEGRDEPRGNRLLIRTWSHGEAMLVRQLLATYGIPCHVVSDIPHTVFPLTVDGLGEIRILVPSTRVSEARSRLADHLRQGLEVLDGGKRSGADENDKEGEDVA